MYPKPPIRWLKLVGAERLAEKNFSGGEIFDNRRSFVSLQNRNSVGSKRYKTSDRSELGFNKSLTSQKNSLGRSYLCTL